MNARSSFILWVLLWTSISVPLRADDPPLTGPGWFFFTIGEGPDTLVRVRFKDNSFTWETTTKKTDENEVDRFPSSVIEGSYTVVGTKLHLVSTKDGKTNSQTFEWRIEKGRRIGIEVLLLDGEGKHYRFERGNKPRL